MPDETKMLPERSTDTGDRQPHLNESIDAVYLWVDGAAAGFEQALAGCVEGPSREAAGPRRYRDNGELRYSLRSLEMHAPWIRKVYLVTNGQAPCWLSLDSRRVELVPHAAIFPDPDHLPTFNSHAIELHLHRIPGLSERFLYFNDDVFLGRPVTLEEFIDGRGGQTLHFEAHRLPCKGATGHPLGESYAETCDLLNRLYGDRPVRPWPAHVPRLFQRSLLRQLAACLPEQFQATSSHRFRNANDLALGLFYSFHLLEAPEEQGRHTPVIHRGPGSDYAFCMMQEHFPSVLKAFAFIAELRPRFFCINDDLDDAPADHPAFATLRGLLEALFPTPSRFERESSALRMAA